ncbi:dihydrolipoyl dehydrogenase [Stenotrophomonas maltophilia]|uniref:dihydrolipoyl dehydrogenase n=1 Tax=Lysobacteraceae TaxID=32033 RepID=UPI0019D43AFD|nr:dihydrolipoyl dehydrogenase [Stenotrophomonas maltophilia]MBN7830510.1 dihydrolipoyl dehydrogenase [Stenotrophomonas maltophilia]MBN7833543.1 dihydrolipoyl dehydrogenase [Stenotrophomonas maltophilia]MBN7859613.1 dihydrolipoyl dehydrogenase [Stenotrophomonas maltophilia]MBN7916383.1 dihydrolipoyl dehydrogenase [Stenotrophomonas maltophilia]MBO2846706.1 dihydrolipoyl dehydrogenase [Stenotrophomonas maltophilia]
MSESKHFDLIVIGGGMSGLPFAQKAALKGRKTALVERELLGGTCLNRGCIPTKTMIHSAKIMHHVRRAAEFGIVAGEPKADLAAIVRRKDEVVKPIRDGAYRGVGKIENLHLIESDARFDGPGRLIVGERMLESAMIVINTGTEATVPPIDGLDGVDYLTNRSALDLTELPESLTIVGGGYVGVEFAQMYARFGSRVTLLQRAERLVPNEEPDISAVLAEVFRREGIEVVTGAEVTSVKQSGGTIVVNARTGAGERTFESTHLLLATGRTPNTAGLNLAAVGVETDRAGFIKVDDQFRTSAAGIWAMGDVKGPPMFTHSARDDAEILYRALIKGDPAATADQRLVPHAVFTDPSIGSVGLTESEARKQGYTLKIGVQPFKAVAKARAIGETDGFIKIIADDATDKVLGAHIIGPEGDNLIHELIVAMRVGATFQDVARAIHIHPTLAEGVNVAAGGVHREEGAG